MSNVKICFLSASSLLKANLRIVDKKLWYQKLQAFKFVYGWVRCLHELHHTSGNELDSHYVEVTRTRGKGTDEHIKEMTCSAALILCPNTMCVRLIS